MYVFFGHLYSNWEYCDNIVNRDHLVTIIEISEFPYRYVYVMKLNVIFKAFVQSNYPKFLIKPTGPELLD